MTKGPANLKSSASLNFGKMRRLQHRTEFQAVYDRRISVADNLLIVYGLANAQYPQGRLGLSVSRKFGKAHERNLWKRRVREAYRQLSADGMGLDLIVIPRRGTAYDFDTLWQSLKELMRRLRKRCH